MQFWEYRFDMLSASLGTYGYTLMTVFLLDIIFNQTSSIGGWNHHQVLMLFGVGQLLFCIYAVFFWSTHSWISEIIRNGELDLFLLKPINSLFAVSTHKFALVETLPIILLPAVLIFNSWTNLNLSVSSNLIWFFVSLSLSMVSYLEIFAAISLLAFWWADTSEITSLYDRFAELHNYPATIYPDILKPLFLTILPVGLTAYAPAVFLLQGLKLDLFIYQIVVLMLFTTLVKILWTKGMQNYSSASS